MSTGSVFKLIANDGKADNLIMATALLRHRIAAIVQERSCMPGPDDKLTPTLADIERSHILYVSAHFKPFAAIGFEYIKVRPSSGAPTLGSGIQFSIPQFGDFFHDMVCRVRLNPVAANTFTTPPQANGTPDTPTLFPFNGFDTLGNDSLNSYNLVDPYGNIVVAGNFYAPTGKTAQAVQLLHWINAMIDTYNSFEPTAATYIDETGTGNLEIALPGAEYDTWYATISERYGDFNNSNPVSMQLNSMIQYLIDGVDEPADPVICRNYTNYCEYPGNRFFDLVKFEVNGNPLDQYSSNVPVMLEKFCVAPNKRIGYNKLVGQENVMPGYRAQVVADVQDEDVGNTPAGILRPTLFSVPQNGGPVVTAALNEYQRQFDVPRELVEIVNGPQTPKPQQPALELWIKLNFWFCSRVQESIPSVAIPFGQRYISMEITQQSNLVYEYPALYLETIAGGNMSYTPVPITAGLGALTIDKIELYVNNIFVNPEIHDIYIKRIGFSLIRVHREQVQAGGSNKTEHLLSSLKWPIEYMFAGFQPTWNIAAANSNGWRDWHRMTRMIDAQTDERLLAIFSLYDASADAAVTASSNIGQICPSHYWLPVPTCDSVSLVSHGITIFDAFSDTMFNSYMPLQYGGAAINTPEDPGALFINMSLFPRSYQPSGHINLSRARETYLNRTTSYSGDVMLKVVAIAINFLLISDGSAVLRYST